MIYNLVLNSTTYLSAASSTDMGQRVYGVDWSFLPENKKFKVSFAFTSKQYATTPYTYSNIYMLAANFGPLALVFDGGSTIQKRSSSVLGFLRVVQGNTTTAADSILAATTLDNPPFMILSRPTNNLLEVWVWKNTTSTGSAMPTDYILTLSFEEV